jgi:hypothetical protein
MRTNEESFGLRVSSEVDRRRAFETDARSIQPFGTERFEDGCRGFSGRTIEEEVFQKDNGEDSEDDQMS